MIAIVPDGSTADSLAPRRRCRDTGVPAGTDGATHHGGVPAHATTARTPALRYDPATR